ncbi:MAG TPA: peptidylprolyl isomerase [Candidatus Hydrogenedentes bacterium]|nr:peptidylprolyl isomerase [Candidatus Hydrogenedentota bacterium]
MLSVHVVRVRGLVAALTICCAAAHAADPVAKIGDSEVVTREEYDRALAAVTQTRMVEMRQRGATADQINAGAKLSHEQKLRLVDSLVNNRVGHILAKEAGAIVTEEEVKAEIESRKTSLPSGTNYEEFLQQRGLTQKDVYESTERRLMMKKFEELKTKDLSVSEDEVKIQFEKLKERGVTDEFDVQHILVKPASNDPAALSAAKEKIEAAAARIKKGEDFGAVAKEVSEDPGSKDKGGEYLNVRRGQMVPEFDARMASAKVGDVSDPFQTQFGWHILKVNRHEVGTLTPELSEKMEAQILTAKRSAFIRKLVEDARAKLNISINLPAEQEAPPAVESETPQPDAAEALIDAAT